MAKFVLTTWAACLARQKPVSTRANPACMKITRIAPMTTHSMLSWPAEGNDLLGLGDQRDTRHVHPLPPTEPIAGRSGASRRQYERARFGEVAALFPARYVVFGGSSSRSAARPNAASTDGRAPVLAELASVPIGDLEAVLDEVARHRCRRWRRGRRPWPRRRRRRSPPAAPAGRARERRTGCATGTRCRRT